ncbi:MAG: DnaB-like helicase C-terminal domain-containing protein [Rhodopila sp.]|nr:DnaB-like helicase C-terminal domain-containing protein [Rhodopila sp.]
MSHVANIEAVETWDALWVVHDEAEIDAVRDAGFPQVIAFVGDVGALLTQHSDSLQQVQRITLVLPTTPEGRRLRELLADRFGRHRCWLVEWPEGCDRASVTAALWRTERVTKCLHEAIPYPIDGLHQISGAALHQLRHERQPKTMSTGTKALDAILRLPTEGRLIIVTGFPGSGKTHLVRFMMVHTAAHEARKWLCFSPEMSPWEHFMAECAQVFHDKPFWPRQGRAGMTDAEIGQAGKWLRDRVTMQVCDAEDKSPTLDWLITGARDAILRHGVTDWCIDPFNEIDHQRGNLTEAEYINRTLQRLRSFANRHGVNVWIIVHPKNPPPLRSGEKREAPGAYDINGGAGWFNKADIGLTVHSPINGAAQAIIWKSRHIRYGSRGTMAELLFDPVTGTYRDNDPNEGLAV